MSIPSQIIESIKSNDPTLTELDLRNQYPPLTDGDIEKLCRALTSNSPIRVLRLNENVITNAGAITLAKTIGTLATLEQLDLSANDIGDEGAVELFRVEKLTHLSLAANQLTDSSAQQLLSQTSTKLVAIDLSGNSIASELIASIDGKLSANTQVSSVLPQGGASPSKSVFSLFSTPSKGLESNGPKMYAKECQSLP